MASGYSPKSLSFGWVFRVPVTFVIFKKHRGQFHSKILPPDTIQFTMFFCKSCNKKHCCSNLFLHFLNVKIRSQQDKRFDFFFKRNTNIKPPSKQTTCSLTPAFKANCFTSTMQNHLKAPQQRYSISFNIS